ncbi:cation:proton antiporter [Niastella populi]|uniref:Sodium:proton antiporter n=1 Tax=Niastella populi TaxID=550983 RepID=A0A1V9G1T8_9BACT|nr:cation:proton antiporter [Niastella populi]OQP64550.1 sodium:proton antiporter [Niastella populi]
MYLLNEINVSLPLSNPVIIFSLVLFIILFAPILFNKIKVPHIIGLILAGMIIGPYGLNLLLRDSSIVLFGTVGLLYIMFTAGLEIDMEEFKKNRMKSLVFGLFTFFIPMGLGSVVVYYTLQFSWPTSLLLAGMFASHTLLAYPIASRYGISRIRSVTLTIGGTIITDILALLVLAGVIGMTKGDITASFWFNLALYSLGFGAIVFFVFPLIARWFFKTFDDSVAQYIFVLAMVFLGAFLAELAGLEHIIGAFLAGLALNRFIPHSSPLMNRIEFVGNAFFIPFFLISVGMLIDFSVLFKGFGALKVAAIMTIIGILSKFIAAFLTQKTFRLSLLERNMIFGLSTARVGATLAIVLVGYNIITGETATGEPIRLLNEDVLNGTIIMILVTCTVSSFIVEKSSRKLALQEENVSSGDDQTERILVSLAYPETVTELIDFGLMLKPKNSTIPVYALNIVSDDSDESKTRSMAKKMMDNAVHHAAATEQSIIPITRYDINISNGIIYTIKEQNITDLVIGLHQDASQKNFLGPVAERILSHTSETVFIYKPVQPFNTLKRILVVITLKAELEPGFPHWFRKVTTIAKESGLGIIFYAARDTISELKDQQHAQKTEIKMSFQEFSQWDDFLIFTREARKNDLLIIVSSRKGQVSYQSQLDKLSYYLTSYFTDSSFILLYPQQVERGIKMGDIQRIDSSLAETISEKVATIGKANKLWKRDRKNRK